MCACVNLSARVFASLYVLVHDVNKVSDDGSGGVGACLRLFECVRE